MENKKRSPIMVIGFAILISFQVISPVAKIPLTALPIRNIIFPR
jgi:hypothetical protein